MTYPDVLAALARERSGTFLAEAKTAHQARQARRYRQANRAAGTRTTRLHRLPPWLQPGLSRRPGRSASSAAEGTPAVLRDGSTVLIRPVRGTDAPLLADGFARLSDRARQAGIDRFTTLVAKENVAMAGLLRNLGACLVGCGLGTVEYEVALVLPAGDRGHDQAPQSVSQR